MQAIIAAPSAPAALRLADVPEPVAGPSQVLLEVHHASLNHGDLNDVRSGRVAAGGGLGSDGAGMVVQAAADGSGPAAGPPPGALAPGGVPEGRAGPGRGPGRGPAPGGRAPAAGVPRGAGARV